MHANRKACDLRCKLYCMVEVRDSRMGYSFPVRFGLGVWPDGRVASKSSSPWPSPSASPEIQVDVMARELYLEFPIGFGIRYEIS